ncbi:hypothetical protein FSARC_3184 [Fusarium sarcochroum]|uniref:Uncharacterized protein n=1 Tax=Fusarium sarcochroum TaxID=1208366 RepID=A0A8H4XCR9_9HYPO|nr:hypothetical protein FSARC_3184 [Fusarium sarcochroum]
MSHVIGIDISHLPLLDNFMSHLHTHIEELLIRLSRFNEVKDHLPVGQVQSHQNIDTLIRQCSIELDWTIRTHNMYKELREMVQPLPTNDDVIDALEYSD